MKDRPTDQQTYWRVHRKVTLPTIFLYLLSHTLQRSYFTLEKRGLSPLLTSWKTTSVFLLSTFLFVSFPSPHQLYSSYFVLVFQGNRSVVSGSNSPQSPVDENTDLLTSPLHLYICTHAIMMRLIIASITSNRNI